MRVIEKTIYQFDELTDSAKEKARNWYRRACDEDTFWSEIVIDMAKEAGNMIGFDVDEIYWRGFWSQGDGACWTGSVRYAAGCARGVAREFPADTELQHIARRWQVLQRRNFYRLRGSVSANDQYMRTSADAYRADDADPVGESDVDQLVSDFAGWIYRALEAEYDYQNADEQVDESIRCNEYEFDENGNRA